MVQGRRGSQESLKSDLVAMLPRLRRFALVLTGDAGQGDALLATVCGALLAHSDPETVDEVSDRLVFGRMYAHWLTELRQRREPVGEQRGDAQALLRAMTAWPVEGVDVARAAALLADLPPQQRAAALLVYGEGFSYADAAATLDTAPETVAGRVAGALGRLLDLADSGADDAATIDPAEAVPDHDRQAVR